MKSFLSLNYCVHCDRVPSPFQTSFRVLSPPLFSLHCFPLSTTSSLKHFEDNLDHLVKSEGLTSRPLQGNHSLLLFCVNSSYKISVSPTSSYLLTYSLYYNYYPTFIPHWIIPNHSLSFLIILLIIHIIHLINRFIISSNLLSLYSYSLS